MSFRVSTAQIFNNGTNGIGKNQSSLYRLQQQMSSGRRVMTPSDDPIAASRAVVLSQSQSFNKQSIRNQQNADAKLSEVDSQLSYLNDRLTGARDLLLQAGNTQLSTEQRSYIATELDGIFNEVLAMANTQDSSGNYIFSGFLGDVRPYSATEDGAAYSGDQGKHLVQASTGRQIATNVTGTEVFNFKTGNGLFQTAAGSSMPGVTVTAQNDAGGAAKMSVSSVDYTKQKAAIDAGNSKVTINFTNATTYEYTKADGTKGQGTYTPGQPLDITDLGVKLNITGEVQAGDKFDLNINTKNAGTGIINQGSIQSISNYNAAVNAGYKNLAIKFTENIVDGKPSLSYQIFDMKDPANPTELTDGAQPYTEGQSISLRNLKATPSDFGISVTIDGTPAGGDTFSIQTSQEDNVFGMLKDAINLLQHDDIGLEDKYSAIEFSNRLAGLIQNMDQSMENINNVRASVGADMQELESLKNTAEDKVVQYASAISDLVDLDYTEAVSNMMRQTLQLQAAIAAFQQTSNLSLFNS